MTSIKDTIENDIDEKTKLPISLIIVIGGVIITAILMFGRLEARVDVVESKQKTSEEMWKEHQQEEKARLIRIEDKLDSLRSRLP